MKTAILIICLATLACSSPGPQEDRISELLEADRIRAEAMVEGARERLQDALHDELTYSHSNGKVDDKSSLIEKLVAGDVDYQAIESPDPKVRVHRSTAIVTGPVAIRVAVGDRTFDVAGIYTAVYRFEQGRWQLIAYHSSPVRS